MTTSTFGKKLDPRVERLLELIIKARQARQAAGSGGKANPSR